MTLKHPLAKALFLFLLPVPLDLSEIVAQEKLCTTLCDTLFHLPLGKRADTETYPLFIILCL